MIEKTISYQLTNYLRDNDLEESLQSAYKTFHSTEHYTKNLIYIKFT